MNRLSAFRNIAVVVVCCLAFASCSEGMDEKSGNHLPDGTYPMTFTAAVDGQAATRATTTNGSTSWEASDPVAISMDGGANHKVYKITNTTTGAMSPDDSGSADNTLYWSKTQETLAAWHPVSCSIGSGGGTGEVSITDQSSGFGTLENILHAPAAQYSYSNGGGSNGSVAFTFRHALAKVKVTLKKEDGKSDFTDDEISNATVRFMGYTTGTLGYSGMTHSNAANDVSNPNGEITPKSETSATAGSPTTYTALLIPQQMQNQKFIKVTIGTGDAAHDYYYTPAYPTDANLEAGKQYTYTITVKKTGLTVASTSASWGNETEISDGTSSIIENYKITITNENNSLSNLEVKDADGTTITAQTDGTYQLPATATSFSVSYTVPSDKKKSLVPTSGLCRMKRTFDSGNSTYTCHYSSVVSDVTLTLDDYAEVGDYYYSDGSWTPEISVSATSASGATPPTAIGVVFYSGAGPDDDVSYYNGSGLTGRIHGYVVAAKDLLNNRTSYGGKLPKDQSNHLQNYDVPEIANGNYSSYNGYSVTKIIKDIYIPQTTEYEFPAFAACATYEQDVQAAPTNSSGWYLPSAAMLDAINGIKGNLGRCPGGFGPNNDYMSCSESDAGSVRGYAFHRNRYTGRSKNDDNTYVRAVLTF